MERIVRAHEHVEFPRDVGCECRPRPARERGEVEAVLPVPRDLRVDRARASIEERHHVTVRRTRPEDGVEGVELAARPRALLAHVGAHGRRIAAANAHERSRTRRTVVEISRRRRGQIAAEEIVKVDGIGRDRPRAAEERGPLELEPERGPSARRVSREKSTVGGRFEVQSPFEGRNEFRRQRRSPRAVVCRIDEFVVSGRVGRIEKDDDEGLR
ncbi:MAG: hypothetical protein NVS3B17_03840 [Vulcanimicrobiaceae bacterium]